MRKHSWPMLLVLLFCLKCRCWNADTQPFDLVLQCTEFFRKLHSLTRQLCHALDTSNMSMCVYRSLSDAFHGIARAWGVYRVGGLLCQTCDAQWHLDVSMEMQNSMYEMCWECLCWPKSFLFTSKIPLKCINLPLAIKKNKWIESNDMKLLDILSSCAASKL